LSDPFVATRKKSKCERQPELNEKHEEYKVPKLPSACPTAKDGVFLHRY
jgi:hypothetical protein